MCLKSGSTLASAMKTSAEFALSVLDLVNVCHKSLSPVIGICTPLLVIKCCFQTIAFLSSP